jgi:hypothetical protein
MSSARRVSRTSVSLKMILWSVVIALLVYGVALYARGEFA